MLSGRHKLPGRSPDSSFAMFNAISSLLRAATDLPRTPEFAPCDVPSDQPNDERLSNLGVPLALPYEVESLAEMDARAEFIVCRLTECVKAKDWLVGFRWWAQELAV